VSYIVYGNRSRGDLLKGGIGGLRRSVARDQAKKAAEGTLGSIKTALENSNQSNFELQLRTSDSDEPFF
jgi:hypothetical protein